MILSGFKNKSFSESLELIRHHKMDWIVKRLSGNDTGATGGHQAGIYLPKSFFQSSLKEINTTKEYNPRCEVKCYFPVNGEYSCDLSAIYYNSKYFPEKGLKKKYDEFRMTGWGGRHSPAQAEENTGCVFLLAVAVENGNHIAISLVAESVAEETLLEEWIGEEIEPSRFYQSGKNMKKPELLGNIELPESWLSVFPNGKSIFSFVLDEIPKSGWKKSLDELLLERRKYEYKVFELIEVAHVMPAVEQGFDDIDSFMKLALSVANRRKSRTGSSLEYNLAAIFTEEGLKYADQVVTENRKKPDFIFPSGEAYHNPQFDVKGLTMLAAKTCCKDRWRQVLNEADKINQKHLFTLQQGVTSNQLCEMEAGGLKLVVPEPNLKSFPREWREKILNLSDFVNLVRKKQYRAF